MKKHYAEIVTLDSMKHLDDYFNGRITLEELKKTEGTPPMTSRPIYPIYEDAPKISSGALFPSADRFINWIVSFFR
jgi:hypothetical protein